MNRYYPFVDAREPSMLMALNRLSNNLVTYWLSVPYSILWSMFFLGKHRNRVRVAYEGHTSVVEVYA